MATERKDLNYYCDRFAALNVSQTQKRGRSPYKPVLLLSVIDLITQGIIQSNQIYVSDELIEIFNRYWNVLAPNYDGGLHYPFFHLQSEGFWQVVPKAGIIWLQPKTTNKLKQSVEYATLDNELFELLQDPNSRQVLIDTLVSVWFTAAQKEIGEILSINQTFQDSIDLELELEKQQPKFYLRKSAVRNAFFRKSVVYIYDYKCAFCQLKAHRALTQTIVDGAHIKPFAEFFDNKVENGISLCKNHHWAFDQGWFTIDENYRILVAEDLQEESPNAKPMREFHHERLLLPITEQYYPSLNALQWHRTNVFRD